MSNKIGTLPIFQSEDTKMQLMQTKWAAPLNQMLRNPLLNGLLLENIPLAVNDNVINHQLGRPLIGWFVTRMQNTFSDIYDTQNSNLRPQLTLQLVSSAETVVDLWVF